MIGKYARANEIKNIQTSIKAKDVLEDVIVSRIEVESYVNKSILNVRFLGTHSRTFVIRARVWYHFTVRVRFGTP